MGVIGRLSEHTEVRRGHDSLIKMTKCLKCYNAAFLGGGGGGGGGGEGEGGGGEGGGGGMRRWRKGKEK